MRRDHYAPDCDCEEFSLVKDMAEDVERMAAKLAEHPDFRVLRRLDPTRERAALSGPTVRRAAIVDTETTGTDGSIDQVIELAVVVFEYCHVSGQVGRVLASYDGLEDPGRPIPPESTAIHGITDPMVAGQRIDDAAVTRLLEGVGIVIAHNARFDRGFLERRLPVFASLPWGCSWHDGRHRAQGAARLGARAVVLVVGQQFPVRLQGCAQATRLPLGAREALLVRRNRLTRWAAVGTRVAQGERVRRQGRHARVRRVRCEDAVFGPRGEAREGEGVNGMRALRTALAGIAAIASVAVAGVPRVGAESRVTSPGGVKR
jgi:hypothetical protein